jgi:hypothetical protein
MTEHRAAQPCRVVRAGLDQFRPVEVTPVLIAMRCQLTAHGDDQIAVVTPGETFGFALYAKVHRNV